MVNQNPTYSERVNIEALDTIAKHVDYLLDNDLLGRFVDKQNDYAELSDKKAIRTQVLKFINAHQGENPKFVYTHKGKSKEGRLFTENSLQGISRRIRHTVCKDVMYDLDIVNCHPILMLNYMEEQKLNYKPLKYYIDNRDMIINGLVENIGGTREGWKQLVLKVLNGGSLNGEFSCYYVDDPQWIVELKQACMECHHHYYQTATDKAKDVANKEAKTFNRYLCKMENVILQEMVKVIEDKDTVAKKRKPIAEIACLVFDGLMIYKEYEGREVNIDNIIQKLNGALCDYGVKCKVKDMDEYIPLDDINFPEIPDVEVVAESKAKTIDLNLDYNDPENVSRSFMDAYGEDIKIRAELKVDYFHRWSDTTKLWEKLPHRYLNGMVDEFLKPHYQSFKDRIECETDKDTLKQLNKTKNLIVQPSYTNKVVSKILNNDKYKNNNFESTLDKTKHLIPIKDNKVVDLRNGQVRDRVRTDLFSFSLDVSLKVKDEIDEKCYKFLRDICVKDEYEKDGKTKKHDPEYMRSLIALMGYCLTGETKDQNFYILYGDGSNGKSTLLKILQRIMGGFYARLNGYVIVKPERDNSSANSHTSHLNPLARSRVAVGKETKNNCVINDDCLKDITGEDTIPLRRLNEEQKDVETQSKILQPCNFKPRMDVSDDAIKRRLKYYPFYNKFESDNIEGKKFVEEVKEKIDDFFSIFVTGAEDYYKTGKVPDSDLMTHGKNQYISENDSVSNFLREEGWVIASEAEYQADTSKRTPKSEVYMDYLCWLESSTQKYIKKTKQQFNEELIVKYKVLLKKVSIECFAMYKRDNQEPPPESLLK